MKKSKDQKNRYQILMTIYQKKIKAKIQTFYQNLTKTVLKLPDSDEIKHNTSSTPEMEKERQRIHKGTVQGKTLSQKFAEAKRERANRERLAKLPQKYTASRWMNENQTYYNKTSSEIELLEFVLEYLNVCPEAWDSCLKLGQVSGNWVCFDGTYYKVLPAGDTYIVWETKKLNEDAPDEFNWIPSIAKRSCVVVDNEDEDDNINYENMAGKLKINEYIKEIKKLGAPAEAIEAAGKYETAEQLWADCKRGDWMLWLIGKKSGNVGDERRKQLVLISCKCARLSLTYVTCGEPRPLKAIEALERWSRGDAGATIDDIEAKAFLMAYDAKACATSFAVYAAANAAFAVYVAANATFAAFATTMVINAVAESAAYVVANAVAEAEASTAFHK